MRGFPDTRWSVVLRAQDSDVEQAHAALGELCEAYWPPLYAYARRTGMSASDAQDAIQGLFAALLGGGGVDRVRAERGRFRGYLLGALKHHLADEHDKASALKRGGGQSPVSLNLQNVEHDYLAVDSAASPEEIYDRWWAASVLARVEQRLHDEYARRDKSTVFEALRGYLDGAANEGYRETGQRLGLREGAVKVAVHRLRKRFGALLRAEVAQTLEEPTAVDHELRFLLGAVRGRRHDL